MMSDAPTPASPPTPPSPQWAEPSTRGSQASHPETPARPIGAAQPAGAPELTVVIPTFNERANVEPLVERLAAGPAGIAWEAIFVDDDSPDGTAAAVRDVARRDARVRCVQRIGRR